MGLRAYFNSNASADQEVDQCMADRNDPSSVGNILLEWKLITQEELEKAVAIQKSQKFFGQILRDVTDGRLTQEEFEDALTEQKIRRNKASHKEIMAFNRRKKARLCRGIQDGFRSIVAKLEENA